MIAQGKLTSGYLGGMMMWRIWERGICEAADRWESAVNSVLYSL